MDTPHVDRSVLCASPGGLHRMAYREWGGGEGARDKPVLVCLHGLTRNGRDFDALGAELGDEFRVVCPDLPGRGRIHGAGSGIFAEEQLLKGDAVWRTQKVWARD